MIRLTRLNHTSLVVNADLIEFVEVTPDTVISLTTGQKLVVLETAGEVVRRVVEFRRAVFSGALECPLLRGKEPAGTSAGPAGCAGATGYIHGRQNPET